MPQSYKIFIKDVPLLITDDAGADGWNGYTRLDNTTADNILPFAEKVMRSRQNSPYLLPTPDPAARLEHMKSGFTLVTAAGGIVWNKSNELLMIYRRGKWDLPKGKVEEGESLETAALREVEEESGVGKLRLLQPFDLTYHIYKEKDTWILKETHWYEMRSQDEGATVPQHSEGITKVKWVGKEEIPQRVKATYASMKDLIQRVLERGYASGAW